MSETLMIITLSGVLGVLYTLTLLMESQIKK